MNVFTANDHRAAVDHERNYGQLLLAWLLNHQTGLINAVLQFLGLEKVGWLVYPNLAMGSIIGVSVWKNLAYTYLLLFAALQQISVEVYEAAKIDGCTAFKALIHITLPLIRPTLLVCLRNGFDHRFWTVFAAPIPSRAAVRRGRPS